MLRNRTFCSRSHASSVCGDLRKGGARRPDGLFALSLVGLLLLLSGCSSSTVFQSSFASNPITAPPTPNQTVGTVSVSGAPNSIVIVGPHPNVSGNWVQLSRSGGEEAAITSMLCNFSQQGLGTGTYSLLAVLYIPDGNLAATVEFGTSGQFTGFMHLDFGPDNTVHVNDGATFGTFTRNQFFTLSVALTVGTSTTAHIQLFGSGASGSMDVTSGIPGGLAAQFGAVNFWIGAQYSGSYQVQNVVVTYKK
jgi:hypothetical protein